MERKALDFMKSYFKQTPLKGAELGVFRGENALRILNMLNMKELHLVDKWIVDEHGVESDIEETAMKNLADIKCVTIYKDYTYNVASKFEDGSLDFVYIDADHSYEGCKLDIELWAPKVKKGGILVGHDYHVCHGVHTAVNEFAEANNYPVPIWSFESFGEQDGVKYGEWLIIK